MKLKQIVWPKFCVACGTEGDYLCPTCWQKLEFFNLCLNLKLDSCYLDQLYAVCRYQAPIPQLIAQMKYQSVKPICIFLSRILYYCAHYSRDIQCVTWVPATKKRVKQRGFNQSYLMAKSFSCYANLPLAKLLIKAKETSKQAKVKSKTERKMHLKDSFSPSEALLKATAFEQIPSSVLIVDDVTTTGSTLNECASVLKACGVKKVEGLTIAHRG